MATYNGFNLDDGINYIITNDDERSQAGRVVSAQKVAAREGVIFLGDDFDKKVVMINGIVFADDSATFKSKLDALKKALNVPNKSLVFDNITYTATLTAFKASTTSEAQTMCSYTAEFEVPLGFGLGDYLTVNLPVTSGVVTLSGSITISGTVYTRPTITYNAPSGSGETSVNKITITHTPTGQAITWSGTGVDTTVNYSGAVIFNYDNFTVNKDGAQDDWSGVFSEWDTGSNDFVVAFENSVEGGTINITYNPYYL